VVFRDKPFHEVFICKALNSPPPFSVMDKQQKSNPWEHPEKVKYP
jgi:hypothetical protein